MVHKVLFYPSVFFHISNSFNNGLNIEMVHLADLPVDVTKVRIKFHNAI